MLITILSSINIVSAAAVDNNITVTIDGKNVDFDVPPQLINSRTMVPLRAIFEALNAVVDWNGETKTVTAQKDDTTISLTINNPTMYVNGNTITLDSPACLISDRTLVPVRAISEAFKARVYWNNETQTVSISTEVPNNESVAEEVKTENKDVKQEDVVWEHTPQEKEDKNEWYSSSMYRVGTDIPAGDYYAVADEQKYSGYYCKYNDSTQNDIEDNDNFKTFTFFRCYNGQYLKLSRCKITPIENAPVFSTDNGVYGEGTYRVGIDMPEGEYKFTATDGKYSGYYCAYTDITYDDIVDNDNFKDVAYYTVKNGQYLELNRCTAVCINEKKSNNVSGNLDKDDSRDDDKDDFEENIDREAPYQKLKSWLVENGTKTSSGSYGILHMFDDGATVSIMYIQKKDYIGFMDTTKNGGIVTLFVYEDENPVVSYETASGSFYSGEYKTPEITFTHMDVPGMDNSVIRIFNAFYNVADSFMKLNGINVKVSDFGINY